MRRVISRRSTVGVLVLYYTASDGIIVNHDQAVSLADPGLSFGGR